MIVILNSISGTAAGLGDLGATVQAALHEHGLTADIWPANSGAEISEFAKRAAASDDSTIVAGGGDGTINAVASKVVGTDKRLGVLPLGTLNHFAKDLGIPPGLSAAAKVIADNIEMRVDVGEVNGRFFLNNSNVGLYPRIVRDREQQRDRLGRGKWPAFGWAVLNALHLYSTVRMTLEMDGTLRTSRTPFLFIGNNAYRMDAFGIGARARLDEGKLSVYYAKASTRGSLVTLAARSLLGRLEQAKNFESLATTEVRVFIDRPTIDVSTDGEVARLACPLHYKVHPGALRVLSPPPPLEEQCAR